MSNRKGVLGFVLAVIGLWPILFFGIFLALLIFAGDTSAEFSLETKNVALNQTLLLVALGITFIVQIVALVLCILALLNKGKAVIPKGLALLGVILSAIGVLFSVLIIIGGLIFAHFFIPKPPGDDGDNPAAIKDQCIGNQENIEVAVGPDMWGFDYPDDTPEDIVKIDLAPYGDLIDNDSGIAYINEGSLNCPADDDPDDTDYELYIDEEGNVKARCIDPEGIAQGHNAR
jgi:hypothetical protein